MKVSVIIPVYKIEQYLDECLQSVFCQTYNDLEIILVDDGSPDRCPQLCDEYAQQDNRIKVIHKKNGGLSDARNAGLKVATGNYILFLDSDDYWLKNDLISSLIEEIDKEKRVDFVLFKRRDYFEDKQQWIDSKEYDLTQINGKTRNDVFYYLLVNQQFNMSACFQIIRRELLIQNNLFFEKGQLSEDIDWSLRLWMQVEKIRATNTVGYAYRHRANSITTTYGIRNQSDVAQVLLKWVDIATHKMQDKQLARLYLGYLAFLYPTLLRNYYLVPKKDRKKEYQLLKPLLILLKYSMTTKTEQVKKIYLIFGFRLTCIVFGLFGLVRKRGWSGLKTINQ